MNKSSLWQFSSSSFAPQWREHGGVANAVERGDEPGVFEFISRSGHVYRREADGTTSLGPRDAGPPPF
jgi:hypothetical protein